MRPTNDPRPRTVVLLQYTGIGDLIWHIHYFKMIAEQSQNGQVTVVAQPSTLTRAFIGKEPWVEAVIDHDHRPRRGEKRKGRHAGLAGMWRMAKQLKDGCFDRIILFSGRPSRGLIAGLSGIPTRMGFGYNPVQRMFLNKGPFIQAYKGQSLAVYPEASDFMVAHGFCKEAVVPRMEPPAELVTQMQARLAHLPRPLYAFAIGTSETHKQWGIDNFAELARRLIEQGSGVVLLGGPAEVQLAKAIEAKVPQSAKHGLAVVTDAPVLGSAAALRVADVCVGNDTGMINVAAAVCTPSFVLIGPRGTLDQDPQFMHNVRASKLSDITVDQVLTLIQAAANGTL
ncbi:MAG: glycosyltransferase family 9 protein [Burkholderiales bacterium]|nr:glycosyltransferase family 9 protein [Burkholderiales bacterium]MDE2433996.1 glycosyltransferase family 9 protein [Burkholderiales bacterium]